MGNICGMTADSREPKYLEICPSVTLSTTNSTWTMFRMHPGCHSEKLATDCLIYATALSCDKTPLCTLTSMKICLPNFTYGGNPRIPETVKKNFI